jgi:hypothetical protein
MHAPVSTFEHRGRQYVIAYSAGNALIGSARGDSVWLFGLDGTLAPVEPGSPMPRTTDVREPPVDSAAAAAPAAAPLLPTADLASGQRLYEETWCCATARRQRRHGGGAPLDRIANPAGSTITEAFRHAPFAQLTTEQIHDVAAYRIRPAPRRAPDSNRPDMIALPSPCSAPSQPPPSARADRRSSQRAFDQVIAASRSAGRRSIELLLSRNLLKTALRGAAGMSLGMLAVPPLVAHAQPRDLKTVDLGGGFRVLNGRTNVLAVAARDGIALVDGGSAAESGALLETVAALPGAGKVHTLFNTHWHPEQTARINAVSPAMIIAQENTRLADDRRDLPNAEPAAAESRTE